MDENLFNQKYKMYKHMIFRVCYGILNSIEDSEEATQDTFIKFYKSNKAFPTQIDEQRYIVRIAINASKDVLRKRKNTYELHENVVIKEIKQNNKEMEYLLQIIDKLKPKYKVIITLKYIEEMSTKEISSILNISEAAVRKRQQRAIEQLKQIERNH